MESKTHYKYTVDDQSEWLPAYEKHFLNHVAKVLPRWVHPNAITILGILSSVASLVLLLLIPDSALSSRPWLYFLAAFCVWLYITADCLDGLHARRTDQCSTLGEFMDHYLDSISAAALIIGFNIGIGMPSLVAGILAVQCLLVYPLQHMGKYYNGVFVQAPKSGFEGAVSLIVLEIAFGVISLFTDPSHWFFQAAIYAVVVSMFVMQALTAVYYSRLVSKHLVDLLPMVVTSLVLTAAVYLNEGDPYLLPGRAPALQTFNLVQYTVLFVLLSLRVYGRFALDILLRKDRVVPVDWIGIGLVVGFSLAAMLPISYPFIGGVSLALLGFWIIAAYLFVRSCFDFAEGMKKFA